MNRSNMLLIIIVHFTVCVFFPSFSLGNDSVCGNYTATYSRNLTRYEGKYINRNWGYSVMIPKKLIGLNEPPDYPQHGLRIELSKNQNGYIWIDGSTNSLEWDSKNKAADFYISIIKNANAEILSIKKHRVRINGFPFLRLIVRYKCPDEIHIRDLFITIDRRQIVYTIALSTTDDGYRDNKKLLETIANTWQLQKIE